MTSGVAPAQARQSGDTGDNSDRRAASYGVGTAGPPTISTSTTSPTNPPENGQATPHSAFDWLGAAYHRKTGFGALGALTGR